MTKVKICGLKRKEDIDADSNVVDSHIGALSAGDMESFVTSAF